MNDLLGLVKQCQRDSERWFPNISNDIPFTVLALCGETGEMANIVKKVARGSVSLESVAEHLGEEAVDALIYLCMVFAQLDIDPVEAYKQKRAKNELRFGKPANADRSFNHEGYDAIAGGGAFAGRNEHWGAC